MRLSSSVLLAVFGSSALLAVYACGSDDSTGGALAPPLDASADGTNATDANGSDASGDAGSNGDAGTSDSGKESGVDSGSGQLDLTFNGGKGFAHTTHTCAPAADGGLANDEALGIALDSVGNIVAGGSSVDGEGHTCMAAWRIKSDGTFDSTFGTNGGFAQTSTFGDPYDAVSAVSVDKEDRPVLTGQSSNSNIRMTIWRLTTAGVLDTTFNGTGFVGITSTTGGGQTYDFAHGIRVDGSDAIVTTGFSERDNTHIDMVTWRYTGAGVLDTSFNGKGWVSAASTAGAPSNDYWDQGLGLWLGAGGKIYTGGASYNAQQKFVATIWRTTAAGAVDTTFNTTGFVTFSGLAGSTNGDFVYNVEEDAAGRIVISGISYTATNASRAFVARLTSAGVFDTTFGTSGVLLMPPTLTGATNTAAYGMKIDSVGRILVAGSEGGATNSAAVWRVTAAGLLDTTFGNAGKLTMSGTAGAPVGMQTDYAWSLTVDAKDRAIVSGESKNAAGGTEMVVWRLTP